MQTERTTEQAHSLAVKAHAPLNQSRVVVDSTDAASDQRLEREMEHRRWIRKSSRPSQPGLGVAAAVDGGLGEEDFEETGVQGLVLVRSGRAAGEPGPA